MQSKCNDCSIILLHIMVRFYLNIQMKSLKDFKCHMSHLIFKRYELGSWYLERRFTSFHLSPVTWDTLHVTQDMWHMTFFSSPSCLFLFIQSVSVPVLLSPHVKRFGMWDFFLQFNSCWINLVNLTLTPPSMTGIILILSTCCSPGLSWKPPPWVWWTGRMCPPTCCSSSRSCPISDCNPWGLQSAVGTLPQCVLSFQGQPAHV